MVIDASVWLSASLNTDINYRSSAQWIRMMNRASSRVSAPAHFPAEVIGVIRRIGPAAGSIHLTTRSLFESEFFAIYEITLDLALLSAEIAGRAAIRGSDAVYVALASMLGSPLVTWDRQQRERGAQFCRTMTPVEAMEILG